MGTHNRDRNVDPSGKQTGLLSMTDACSSTMQETPRYLIKSGKPEKAAKSLSRLRRLDYDHPALVEELAEIQANHDYEMSIGKASYLDCFRGNIGKRLLTGCGLQALQQLSGEFIVIAVSHWCFATLVQEFAVFLTAPFF